MEQKKILVVATSDLCRSFNISILRAEDYLAEGATDETEAQEKLTDINFDMVLIDSINTSNFNITNFIDKRREENIDTPFVILVNGGENSPLGAELTLRKQVKVLPLMPPRQIPNRLKELF